MIIIPVIWVSFDFRPCKKKTLKYILVKKNCLKKIPDPTSCLTWHVIRHVAVADCTTFDTWQST